MPYGVIRLLAGLAFSLGLILVIVGGAELFTGNNLLGMAWASRRISTAAVVRNWVIVYAGNFVGALGTAVLVVAAGQYAFGGGAVGATALATAATKVGYDPLQAFVLGILCNGLVCLAVWLTYSARTTTDRILAIVPPIAAFVAMGFEHSIANMYFIPVGHADPGGCAGELLDVDRQGPGRLRHARRRGLRREPRAGHARQHRRGDGPGGRRLLAGLPAREALTRGKR